MKIFELKQGAFRRPPAARFAIFLVAVTTSIMSSIAPPAASAALADPTPPSTITLTVSQPTFVAGDSAILTAGTDQLVDGLGSIKIVDQSTSSTVKTCSSGSECEVDISFATGGPRTYVAKFDTLTSDPVTVSRAGWTVDLTSDASSVDAGSVAHLQATTNQDVSNTDGHYEIDIFDLTAGTRVAHCTTGTICAAGGTDPYADASPSHMYEAMVAAIGSPSGPSEANDVQATSNTTEVDRTAWNVDLVVSPTSGISAGDIVSVTATINQDVSLTNGRYVVYLVEVVGGSILKTCTAGLTCSANFTWRSSDYALAFAGFVAAPGAATYDDLSDVQTSTYQGVELAPWKASISTDKTVMAAGETNTVTATANQNLDQTAGLALYIVEWSNDRIVKACTTGTVCIATDSFYRSKDDQWGDHDYAAVVARYDPNATAASQIDGTTWRGSSSGVRVEMVPWTLSVQMVNNSAAGYAFILRTNQNVGLTNGVLQMTLYNNDTGASEASCVTGTVCILSSTGPLSTTGYLAFVGESPTPTNESDDNSVHAGVGILWATTASGPQFGPMLPGESAGGRNPAEKGCQCSHADPVNSATGEYYESVTDLSLSGIGPQLASGRTYSSLNAAQDGPFGFGWAPSWGAHVQVIVPTDDSNPLPRQVQVTQENGSTVLFTRNGSGDFVAPTRVMATLTWSDTSHTWTYKRNATDRLTFDASGALASVKDLNGNTLSISHNPDGTIHQVSGSGGRSITFTWTGSHITSETDSAARTVAFTYDSYGNLATVTDPTGAVSAYGSLGDTHRLTTVTNPVGGVTTTTYDDSGRVSSQTDPVGQITTFSYSTDGSNGTVVTTITDPNGSVTNETYSLGLLVSVVHAVGTPLEATTSHVYDASANLLSTTDPLGAQTVFTYDSAGNVLTATDPLGHTLTNTYNSLNEVLTSTDALGRVSTNTYDSYGNLTTATTPSGRETVTAYNTDGTVDTLTDPRGKTTSFGYDAAGRVVSTSDPLSRTQSVTYDAAGFAVSKTDGENKTTTLTVDALGRTLTTTDPSSDRTTAAYDGDGNRTSWTDANGKTSTSSYNHANQRVSTTDPMGNTSHYTYSALGKLASSTDPESHVTTSVYDALGRLISTTDPLNRMTSYGYDAAGRPTSITLPSGAESTVSYDLAGNKSSATDARGKTTTYSYDAANELISVTDPDDRTTTTSYTADGQVHTITLPDSSTESYTYNHNGQVLTFVNADGKTTHYGYDDASQLVLDAEPGFSDSTVDYDNAGRVSTVHRPDGTTVHTTYDASGRATLVHYSNTGSTDTSYEYDATGRRTQMTDETGASTYGYDDNGHLVSETNGAGAETTYTYTNSGDQATATYPGNRTVSYSYDDAGEMTGVTDWNSHNSTFTWTPDGQVATRVDPNGMSELRTYDANGDVTGITVATSAATVTKHAYTYDAASQLTSFADTDPTGVTGTTNYGYDALGQLTTASGTAGYTATSAGFLTQLGNARPSAITAASR